MVSGSGGFLFHVVFSYAQQEGCCRGRRDLRLRLVGAGSALGTPANSDPSSSLLIAALANGLGLGMVVSATMGTSGGVLNPAVAIGLLVGGKLPSRDVLPYVVARAGRGHVPGGALVLAFPFSLGNPVHWGAPTLSAGISALQGIGIEALLTFVLVIAIFVTAVDSRAPHIGGPSIGLAVLADVLVGGTLTGAAMNPARAYGPPIRGAFFPSYWYVYLAGPVLGAIAAGLVYRHALETKQ